MRPPVTAVITGMLGGSIGYWIGYEMAPEVHIQRSAITSSPPITFSLRTLEMINDEAQQTIKKRLGEEARDANAMLLVPSRDGLEKYLIEGARSRRLSRLVEPALRDWLFGRMLELESEITEREPPRPVEPSSAGAPEGR